MIYKNKAK